MTGNFTPRCFPFIYCPSLFWNSIITFITWTQLTLSGDFFFLKSWKIRKQNTMCPIKCQRTCNIPVKRNLFYLKLTHTIKDTWTNLTLNHSQSGSILIYHTHTSIFIVNAAVVDLWPDVVVCWCWHRKYICLFWAGLLLTWEFKNLLVTFKLLCCFVLNKCGTLMKNQRWDPISWSLTLAAHLVGLHRTWQMKLILDVFFSFLLPQKWNILLMFS